MKIWLLTLFIAATASAQIPQPRMHDMLLAAQPAVATAWTPASIPDLLIGFEPRKGAYNSGTTQATDGQSVLTLVDYWSGNNYNAQQSRDETNKPLYLANGMGGNVDVLRVTNSTGNFLRFMTNGAELLGSGALTIAGRIRIAGSGATSSRLFDNGKAFAGVGFSGGGFSRDGGTTVFSPTWSSLGSANYFGLIITFSAASPSLCNVYTNNVLASTADGSVGNPASGTASLMYFNRAAFDRGLTADLAYLFIYTRVLTSDERAALESYMK